MLTERFVALSSLGVATWVAMIEPVHEPGATPPIAWEGPGAHLHAVGTIGGSPLEVQARGAQAIDAIHLECDVRETRVSSRGGARPSGIRFEAEVEGRMRIYELALVGHAVERIRDGSHLHVVPLSTDPTESDSSIQFAFEWREASTTAGPRAGRASELGTFHRVALHRPTSPEADVLAGHLRASWTDGDALDLSFTVPCRR